MHSLKVMQIPSKMDDGFSNRKQKPCKGCRFYAWPMLKTRNNSGTVIHDVTLFSESGLASDSSVEPNGLKPVVLRVLHVQPVVTGGTLDQRCRVQDAKTSLAQ